MSLLHFVNKSATTVLIVLLLSSCATLIGRGALSPPMLNLDLLEDDDLVALGYTASEYCADESPCLSYLRAGYYDAAGRQHWQQQAEHWHTPIETRAMEVRLRFWPSVPTSAYADTVAMAYDIELDTTRGQDRVALHLDSPVAEVKQGTYVLVHGFRTNKESLFFIAESMRYSGFDVVLVDLFGHGNSAGNFTFSGLPDAKAISALIDDLALAGPIHLAGMSMGGTTSTHLAKQRDDIASLLLLAPMIEFVDAFVDAGRAYTRSAHLVPQSSLQRGARYALEEAGSNAQDTAVVQQVGKLEIPVLIMASSNDKISPLEKLQALQGDKVEVRETAARTHHGMILWDSDDYAAWLTWLGTQN